MTESRKRGRRRMVAAGACLALVLAVGGVMLAVGTAAPRSMAAPGPVRHTAGTIVLPDPTIIIGTTTTTTAPTTTTTTPTTTTRTTTKASPPQAPPPQTTTTPPKLNYVPLIRYHDRSGHHVTLAMGHAAPSGFSPDAMLGYLVTTNAPGTVRFYLCRAGSGYFSSVDQSGGCEGQTTLAMQGYLYSAPPPGNSSSALYRCGSGSSSEDSLQAGCEGAQREGYVELPTRG